MGFLGKAKDTAQAALTLAAALKASNAASNRLTTATSQEDLDGAAKAYAKAAEAFENASSANDRLEKRYSEEKNEEGAETARRVKKLRDEVRATIRETEENSVLTEERKKESLAKYQEILRDLDKMEGEPLAGRLATLLRDALTAAKFSMRSSAALCAGEREAAEALGRAAGEAGERTVDLARKGGGGMILITSLAALGLASGAVSARLRAEMLAERGVLTESQSLELEHDALWMKKKALEGLKTGGAADDLKRAIEVCAGSEASQIAFIGGRTGRAGEILSEMMSKAEKETLEEIGSKGGALLTTRGFGEFARKETSKKCRGPK